VIDAWRQKFGLRIRIEQPTARDLGQWVAQNGLDGIYESVALRQQCCHLRKIEPLERALKGKKAWFTGLRRGQSSARQETLVFDRDAHGRLKVSPLADWSLDQTWSYVKAHGLPYNKLHDEGFPSIGCEPCTRAVRPGEDIRAGRWWWEVESKKECGLHGRTLATTPQLEITNAHQS
jgi:phosphoadenosine phosphosulfate reductase